MRRVTILASIAIIVCAAIVVFAANLTPAERGKILFNDEYLGGGTAGRSCNTCHPEGKGLTGIGDKKSWKTPAGESRTIEEAVNICITAALQGKALDVKSDQMKDLVSYLRSLKPTGTSAPAKKPAVGC
jgi:cytochrome c5